MIGKIISGGQTGADQAGLDAAIELGITHGGWLPKGRKTEDGPLPDKYRLKEIGTVSYPKRTEKNILDADGTVIFSFGNLNGGSALTAKLSGHHGFPWIHIDLKKVEDAAAVKMLLAWIDEHKIRVLNVAGPRASKAPKIYDATKKILIEAIETNKK